MRIVLSTSSATPIYEQIKTQARSAILSGEVLAGQSLPSLRHLAADLRVSVITVTRAYNDLVAEGLVRNEHGRGFVVLDVDPQVASTALLARIDEVLHELVVAAGNAHMTRTDVHDRLDDIWRDDD